MSEAAGDFSLASVNKTRPGKMKRAEEECLPRVRNRDSREMVGDFLKSGGDSGSGSRSGTTASAFALAPLSLLLLL